MKLHKLSHFFNKTNKKDQEWQQLVEQSIEHISEDPNVLKECQRKVPQRCMAIKFMFSDQSFIKDLVLKNEFGKREDLPNDIYSEDYLPFHLRDYEWLAKYLMATAPNMKLQEGPCRALVQAQPFFVQERSRYERDLAGELIYYMMHHQKPNALIAGQDIIYHYKGLVDFDKIFRQHAIKVLQGLGLDYHDSEVLVELQAGKWRNEAMSLAFENKFYGTSDLNGLHKSRDWIRWEWFRNAHKKAWIQYREFQYGKAHHKILNELGLFTENMKMDEKQVVMLRKRLKTLQEIYERIIASQKKKLVESEERIK